MLSDAIVAAVGDVGDAVPPVRAAEIDAFTASHHNDLVSVGNVKTADKLDLVLHFSNVTYIKSMQASWKYDIYFPIHLLSRLFCYMKENDLFYIFYIRSFNFYETLIILSICDFEVEIYDKYMAEQLFMIHTYMEFQLYELYESW